MANGRRQGQHRTEPNRAGPRSGFGRRGGRSRAAALRDHREQCELRGLGPNVPRHDRHAGYWAFFPSGDDALGLLPVWGFAQVVASNCEGVAASERWFGFFPLASHLVVRPTKVTPMTLVDGTEHRTNLAAVYNEYLRVSALPNFQATENDLWPVFRPLLTTGFLIADQFADDGHYGAEQVVIGSASSKTALMTAKSFQGLDQRPKLVGLTSTKNQAFVTASGLYDDVVTYDRVDTIAREVPTAFVDMANNGEVTERVHVHFADNLKYSMVVGLSHWDAQRVRKKLPGPAIKMFFAPGRIKKRARIGAGAV